MKLLSINGTSSPNWRLWTLAIVGMQLSFSSFSQSLPKLMN